MRSSALPKPIVLAALGCMMLTACGTQGAGAGPSRAGSTASTASPVGAASEVRLPEPVSRIAQQCTPDAPTDDGDGDGDGDGSVPRPEDLPGFEAATPAYGPGQTPPGTPNAEGEIPVPVKEGRPTPAPDTPAASDSPQAEEVPLPGGEECG